MACKKSLDLLYITYCNCGGICMYVHVCHIMSKTMEDKISNVSSPATEHVRHQCPHQNNSLRSCDIHSDVNKHHLQLCSALLVCLPSDSCQV